MYFKLGMSVFLILAWAISVHAERMCHDVTWRKLSDPAALCTGTARVTSSGNFKSEIERNSALKCAIEKAREYDSRILRLLEQYKYLDRDDVELIMAYTDEDCKFYDDLNKDTEQHGLNGGSYPVTKNKLQNALLSMGKKMTFPSQLYRKEDIQFLYKYEAALNSGTLELDRFTSTSDKQCLFKCQNGFVNIIYQNPSYGANIAEFSNYDEREWLLPPFVGELTVKSINKGKDPPEVIVEGSKSCNAASMFSLGSKDYMLVCFFSSLVMALFTHPGIINIG